MSNGGGKIESGGFKELIRAKALRLGFSHCGFARNDSLEELRPFYSGFIRRKGHASLDYLETNFEKRLHPELVSEGTKTVIALLMNYFPPEVIPAKDNFIIAKYAYGTDYHKVMRERIGELAGFMQGMFDDIRVKGLVDSGVVLEKDWAQKCGVGWQGKIRSSSINQQVHSFLSGSFSPTWNLNPICRKPTIAGTAAGVRLHARPGRSIPRISSTFPGAFLT
jgi:epoxyqueuosine reductase